MVLGSPDGLVLEQITQVNPMMLHVLGQVTKVVTFDEASTKANLLVYSRRCKKKFQHLEESTLARSSSTLIVVEILTALAHVTGS